MTAQIVVVLVLALGAEAGVISSPVGTGEAGFSGDGGPAAEANLNGPFGLAFDREGNLYLSDTGNHRIRKVDAKTDVISTVAGNGEKGFSGDGGPATEAKLDEPYGLAIDKEGSLYFADRLNRRVRVVDGKTGVISTVAGDGSRTYSGDGGPGGKAGLVEPNSVALDGKGRLYIADVAGHRIRVVDLKTGRIDTFAGTGKPRHDGDGGPAREASIHGARAVQVGPDGTVYLLEREGNSLRSVDGMGIIHTVAGTGKKGYSGDGGQPRLATFNGPKELAVDPKDGSILVVDTENHAIRRMTLPRQPGIALIETVAGDGRKGGSGDGGPSSDARLNRPHGVAVSPDGAILIGDTGNNRIRRVAP